MFKKIMFLVMVLGLVSSADALVETFDTGLGSFNEQVGNRISSQNFGWSNTNNAGGTAGELGGIFARTDTFPHVANTTIGVFQPTDTIVIKGRAKMSQIKWDGGVDLGYYKQGVSGIQIGFSMGEPKPDDGYPNPRIFVKVGNSGSYVTMIPWNQSFTYDLTYSNGTLTGNINGVSVNISGTPPAVDAFGIGVAPLFVDLDVRVYVWVDNLEYTANTTIGFATVSGGNEENITPAVLTVKLNNPFAGQTYTVDYAVKAESTANGSDYTLTTPSPLVFAPGETTKTISIAINNDGINEEDETIILELSNATGPGIELIDPVYTYTIIDPRPKITFESADSEAPECDTPAMIAVKLLKPAVEPVSVDYAVTGGTADGNYFTLTSLSPLTFAIGESTKYISMDVVDNRVLTPDLTVVITLFNASPINSCSLGAIREHTYTILDDDLGTRWEKKMWYFDQVPSRLFVNADGDLEVNTPRGDDGFVTRIADHNFSQPGDVVEVSYIYMSDGQHDCADCQSCPGGCYNDDITCLDGTSDMRFGFFESNGDYRYGDRKGPDTVVGYKGYGYRFGPHMPATPTRWVDPCNETHKTGMFCKKEYYQTNLLSDNTGLMDYIPGFGLDPNVPSMLTLRMEQTSSSDVKLSITLNNQTCTMTDTSITDQPQKIDVFAWGMRNNRPYSRMVLGSTLPSECPGDFNNDLDVNNLDLEILAGDWLKQGTTEIRGTAPNTSALILNYRFEGTAGVAILAGANAVPNLAPGGLFPLCQFVDSAPGDKGALKYGVGNPVTGSGTSADYQNPSADPGTGLYAKDNGTTAIDLNIGAFTIETFIKPRTLRDSRIIGKSSTAASSWLLTLISSGEVSFGIGGETAPNAIFTGAGTIAADTWYHVVAVFDETATKSMKVYLDGAETVSGFYNTRPITTSNALGVGCKILAQNPTPPAVPTNSGAFFNGLMDELRVYSYALSEDEVIYQANNGVVVTYNPLVSKAELVADDIINLKDFAAFAQYWLENCE